MAKRAQKNRIERDSMGEMEVPPHVLYGASTQRAVLNFPISGKTVPPAVIHAFALLKRSAAVANLKLAYLDQRRAKLIVQACDEVLDSFESPEDAAEMMQHFPIDVFPNRIRHINKHEYERGTFEHSLLEYWKPHWGKGPCSPK